jgi:hypothetical protein
MLPVADHAYGREDWFRDQHGRDYWGRPRDLTWAFNRPLQEGPFRGTGLPRCSLCPAALHLGGGSPLLNHLCPPHQGFALARSRRLARLRSAALTIQLWWRAWLEAKRTPEDRGKRWWIIDP